MTDVDVNIYEMTDTWNNAATTFTAIEMNVTDTASAAASLLFDLQVASASKFSVDKNGSMTFAGAFFGTNDITPDELTADQDDWSPTGISTTYRIRVSTDASRSITGLTGGADGRVIALHNHGTNDVVLKHEDASSTAANRFELPQGNDFTLKNEEAVLLYYDDPESRWHIVAQAAGAGTGDVIKVGTPVNNQIGVWTGDGTLEGDAALTFDTTTDTLAVGASGKFAFGAVNILSDSAGTTTLSNIDALDATSEATIEAAIDTLANLASAGGTSGSIAGPSGTWDTGGMDIASGDTYAINSTDVLSATTLGSAVVTSSLTTVGALNSGSITSGFGSIDVGASAITTTGTTSTGALTATGLITAASGTWDNFGIDIATGDTYAINGTDVLNATTLGSGVVTSSLTTVGALGSGSIAAGFGAIDNGTSNITTGGILALDVDGSDVAAAGSITLGAGSDAGIYWDGTNLVLDTQTASVDITADAGDKGTLLLSTKELTVVDGDVLGQIDFQAPLESSGTDAILVAASIWAEADAEFSSSVNTTDLVFATGDSETATEKMRLDSVGNLGIGTAAPDGALHVMVDDASFTANALANDFVLENVAGCGLTIAAGGGSGQNCYIIFADTADDDVAWIQYNHVDDSMRFRINGTDIYRLNSTGNMLINAVNSTSAASADGTFHMRNANAVPTGNYLDGIVLYAEDVSASSELKVRDEAGNITTLSPHNFELIPEGPSEELAWAHHAEKDGKKINIDMLRLARVLERLSGEKLVYIEGDDEPDVSDAP